MTRMISLLGPTTPSVHAGRATSPTLQCSVIHARGQITYKAVIRACRKSQIAYTVMFSDQYMQYGPDHLHGSDPCMQDGPDYGHSNVQ